MKERTGILSAYYLSGRDTAALYASMSPVNTFRLIFNEYLGTSYDLLPDRSYFSTWSRPYRFVEVAATESSDASRHNEGQLATHVGQECPPSSGQSPPGQGSAYPCPGA